MIAGGEPTLLGWGFIDLVRHIKNWLPHTALHILPNGRSFFDRAFVQDYARVGRPDVVVGTRDGQAATDQYDALDHLKEETGHSNQAIPTTPTVTAPATPAAPTA